MRVTPTLLMLTAAATLLAQSQPITEQAARGKVLFFETTKGQPCATCHQMEGKGSEAGPDLKMIAALSPRGIIMAVLASRTAYMQEVKTSAGQTFPGLLKGQAGDVSTYYDFSTTPPAKRELKKAEIADTKDNAKWKHPPESTGYTKEELADVIAYVRWAGKGHTTPVKPEDMNP
jgi:putative heme-binding domain-containing protein